MNYNNLLILVVLNGLFFLTSTGFTDEKVTTSKVKKSTENVNKDKDKDKNNDKDKTKAKTKVVNKNVKYYSEWDFQINAGKNMFAEHLLACYTNYFAVVYKKDKPTTIYEYNNGKLIDRALFGDKIEDDDEDDDDADDNDEEDDDDDDSEDDDDDDDEGTTSEKRIDDVVSPEYFEEVGDIIYLSHYMNTKKIQWTDVYKENRLIKRKEYQQDTITKITYCDENFRMIKREAFSKNGNLIQTKEYFYNVKNLIAKENVYNHDDKLTYKSVYEYRDNLELSEVKTFDTSDILQNVKAYDNGKFVHGKDYIYEADRLKYIEIYGKNNSLDAKEHYNKENTMTKKEYFSDDKKLYLTEVFKYDEKNRNTILLQYNTEDSLIGLVEKSYNNSGYVYKEVKKNFTRLASHVIETYFYYNNNKAVVKKKEDYKYLGQDPFSRYYDESNKLITQKKFLKIQGKLYF